MCQVHMNILFIIKVRIHVFIKWSYRFSQISWLLNLEWLAYFKQVSLCCTFLDQHLTTCFSQLGVQIVIVFELGTSTLM
jgi:hypothetical protein